MTYELHPLCTLFPRVTGAEFDALVQDIRANGLRQPIVLHNDMILDGGNRYRACLQAGVQPHFEHYEGESIVAFVLSANLHRRHLSAGQQAAIVASAQDWATAQKRGGTGANQHKEQTGNLAALQTVAQRAAESGASERTQRMADKVVKTSPELGKKVAQGEVTLPEAMQQLTGKRPGAKPAAAPAPAPAEQPPQPEDTGPDESELAANRAAEQADREALEKLLEADDKLATAVAEVKRLNHLNAQLQQRINGLMNEKAEAIKLCKSLQRKLDKLQKVEA